jgi:molecular chaperone Hsp33
MADYVIRATAAEGQIRAFAATTRDLTETARQAHNTSPVATAALGRLMTAAVMMGYDMKGADDHKDPGRWPYWWSGCYR